MQPRHFCIAGLVSLQSGCLRLPKNLNQGQPSKPRAEIIKETR